MPTLPTCSPSWASRGYRRGGWRWSLSCSFARTCPTGRAAEAVRARIDWKYLLGLELADPGFDHSVLCAFRARLLAGSAEERLLHKLLEACQRRGLLKARGRQRTDATHVVASVRALNRLELVGETLRAALNELAIMAPDWLRGAAPEAWYERYAYRLTAGAAAALNARPTPARSAKTGSRCSTGSTGRDARGPAVAAEDRGAAAGLATPLRARAAPPEGGGSVRFRRKDEPPSSAETIETPYDPAARFRTRSGTSWTGYVVHLTETCEDDVVNLLTHAMTTIATVHEAKCTAAIHAALVGKGLPSGEHLVDAAYVDAELLVRSREELDIALVGPGRPNPIWQSKVEGAYTIDRFEIDWDVGGMRCPRASCPGWSERVDGAGRPTFAYLPASRLWRLSGADPLHASHAQARS